MSAVYWKRDNDRNARVLDCPSVGLLWPATRINHNLHWRWDDSENCYQTHRWTNDARYADVRSWPAETALSSLLRAVREDDRMAGDPLIRMIAFYVTVEYLTNLVDRRFK